LDWRDPSLRSGRPPPPAAVACSHAW
jgi:hypothetical protein